MKSPHFRVLLLCLLSGVAALRLPSSSFYVDSGLPIVKPESIGLVAAELAKIDVAVQASIDKGEMPGAIVIVARKGKIGYQKVFGNRALKPKLEKMTIDTIFDMASLTKVMATTPAIMQLLENNSVRIGDPVKNYLPRFVGDGKDLIKIRHLLTHHSGLKPDFDLSQPWHGYAAAMAELWKEKTDSKVDAKFIYSDLNFIALGEIVRKTTGMGLESYVQQNVYEPLGMSRTAFNPPAEWQDQIAPTETRFRTLQYLKGEKTVMPSVKILRGEVHDPTSWRMEGVAGHAGLFSNAHDLAVYAQMILNGGTYKGIKILSEKSVEDMTRAQSPKASAAVRGYGWDIQSQYSSPAGDHLKGGFGHTGFTGSSLWIHPPSESFIIILGNRVHPNGTGNATPLRRAVANIVAKSFSPSK